jgi:hypothetical protein
MRLLSDRPERRHDVGMDEIVALEKQRQVPRLGKRIGETITQVEIRRVSRASAKAHMGRYGHFSKVLIEGDNLELQTSRESMQAPNTIKAELVPDDNTRFDPGRCGDENRLDLHSTRQRFSFRLGGKKREQRGGIDDDHLGLSLL